MDLRTFTTTGLKNLAKIFTEKNEELLKQIKHMKDLQAESY